MSIVETKKSIWAEEIEKVKVDATLTEEERKRLISNYELFEWQENYLAQKRKRKANIRKARLMAKQILGKADQVKRMQKELSEIFYYDKTDRAFSHMDRTCEPKNENIRKALRVRIE